MSTPSDIGPSSGAPSAPRLRPAAGELASRRPVWAALAGMFVDADVSLTRDARVAQLAASVYTLAEIEQILTEEVYPVCWHTLQADAGQGEPFDADWLAAQILGRTTGWAHRMTLARRGVHMVAGVEYLQIDDAGLHTRVNGEPRLFEVDTVILCAGQTPLRTLYDELQAAGVHAQLVGGAFEAAELDAKRAIDQASRLAAVI